MRLGFASAATSAGQKLAPQMPVALSTERVSFMEMVAFDGGWTRERTGNKMADELLQFDEGTE